MYFARLLVLANALAVVCLVSAAQQPSFPESSPPPQEPKPPFPYSEQEVKYPNPQAEGVFLAGTLTEPKTDKPFPSVLLITGAGPQDRDETTSGHKPFLVLSDYLTRRGIAVLRVDDRGTAASTGSFETSTTQDFESDAEAGVKYLMSRTDIDQKRIGLIGHGEGAIIAPMLAAKIPQIAFIVLLAGPAVPGEEILLEQTERSEEAAELPEDQIKADKKIGRLLYDMVREGKPEPELRRALLELPRKEQPFIATWQRQIHRLESPWLRFFLSYDPAPALGKVKCPVLAIYGQKDLQVIPEQNVRAMKTGFSKSGNHDVTIEVLPELNYMFQTAKTGLGWEYETIPETISPKALNAIGAWVAKHTQ